MTTRSTWLKAGRIIAGAAFASVLFSATQADDELESVKSREARKAIAVYQAAVADLDKSFQEEQRKREADYWHQVAEAREVMKELLKLAQDVAIKNADLDDAVNIRDLIRSIESGQTDESSQREKRIKELESELSRLKAGEKDSRHRGPGIDRDIIGIWRWDNGLDVTVKRNGTSQYKPRLAEAKSRRMGGPGKWRVIDEQERIVEFQWGTGKDVFELSKDGRFFEGPVSAGSATRRWAVRID